MTRRRVMHLICPRGMYGAERWIVALISGLRERPVTSWVCIPIEDDGQRAVAEQFRAAGCDVHTIDVIGAGTLGILRALHTAVAERRPDIVHTHGYKSDILGLRVARRAAIPLVSTPHGFGQPTSVKHRAMIAAGKFALRFADRVAPLSAQLEREVLAAGVPAERVVRIVNAVDLHELEQMRGRRETNGKVIGFVGQMIPRKRIDHLLRIFERLWQQDPALELHLVGSGESEAGLRQHAATLASANSIRFFGFRTDRLALMGRFDLFAMTSADEGVPRCLMEAMAMGVAAVGYDIPGVDALIIDGETGRLAESGDEAAFADACAALLAAPAERERLAAAGAAHIERHFSNRRMADEYLSLYQSLSSTQGES